MYAKVLKRPSKHNICIALPLSIRSISEAERLHEACASADRFFPHTFFFHSVSFFVCFYDQVNVLLNYICSFVPTKENAGDLWAVAGSGEFAGSK